MSSGSWLAIAAAVLISGFVTLFAVPGTTVTPVVSPHAAGFATLGTVTDTKLPPLPLPGLITATSTTVPVVSDATQPVASPSPAATTKPAQTPAPQKSTAVTPAAAVPPPAVAVAVTPLAATTSATSLSATVGLVQGALVNIICVPHAPNLKAASATGVVIDPRGIILTVAHMAQFFLLADYPSHDATQCVIRTGSPAKTAYTAQLIYISPEWIKANPTTLVESVPLGTGENDYAFLAITGSATDASLPASFSAIPLSHTDAVINDPVTIGSYGAEFLNATQIESALYPIIVFDTITDRFTFASNTPDLVSVTNTAAAQEGSSGGVMVTSDKEISALITTSSQSAGNVTSRTLHAITPNYIRRAFVADTGEQLDTYLSDSTLSALIQKFASEKLDLASLLESHLQ